MNTECRILVISGEGQRIGEVHRGLQLFATFYFLSWEVDKWYLFAVSFSMASSLPDIEESIYFSFLVLLLQISFVPVKTRFPLQIMGRSNET